MVNVTPLVRNIQKIYVSNIPWTCTSKEVTEYLRQFGSVHSGHVYFDAKTGISKRYGVFYVNDNDFIGNIMKVAAPTLEGNILVIQLNENRRIDTSNCIQA